jgi:hypothetical protein
MPGVDVDDLYGLPLDQFIPERTALARELRGSGDRERAGEVGALRKPSVAAWAVNQLVRTQRKPVADLLEAGDALRSAQDDVLAGRGDAQSLRAAVEHERAAVGALTEAARGLLSSEGQELSDTMIERVSDTLHAAALDDEARARVTEGRLERELQHVGLGGFGALSGGGAPAAPVSKSREKPKATTKAGADGKKKAGEPTAERDRTAREQAKAQEEARREARAIEKEARRRAERAGRVAKLALERRDKAAEALREAEADLEAAEAQVREADEAVREAEAALRDAAR